VKDDRISGGNCSLAEPVTQRDHAAGPADAPVTLVEYGDYECPSCLNAVPIVGEVRRALGDRLRFVFRHFPQSSIHPHASAAAEAAEAAADQGKFWEMHEALFRHQKELGEVDFGHLALTIGLEIYRFDASRSGERHRGRIRTDHDGGVRSGVTRTPTFFVNGSKYFGSVEASAIVAACEAAAAKAHQSPK
jgi:protein-disulfide isomerase